LIGFGSRFANGDTAYHGYSGLPIFSKRSMTAMTLFILSAMGMATLRSHIDFLKGNSAHKIIGNAWIIGQYVMIGVVSALLIYATYFRIRNGHW